MPIRLPMNGAFVNYQKVVGDSAHRDPQVLVKELCSKPLPAIDTRTIQEKHLAHIINPEHVPAGEPFDCFASQSSLWNMGSSHEHIAIWLFIDYPTQSCTFDLYLHRDMARNTRVSADCHLWGTSLLAPPEDLWMTRFSDALEFHELGTGISNSYSKYNAKNKEVTQHLFESNQWDADEFIGFRCEVRMPIWRSGICIIIQ